MVTALVACGPTDRPAPSSGPIAVANALTRAQSASGEYISWKEHRIDDSELAGFAITGSDGLVLGDLDQDGHEDIVSVHESDTTYDGVADGYIRIAFGTGDPARWELATLAAGAEAGAAEDVAIGDVNGDGRPDIVAACELAHLIYFENPGSDLRTGNWPRVIPKATLDRGSFIRVFLADFNDDGRLEVVTPNKGGQNPEMDTTQLDTISYFEPGDEPLAGDWDEVVLARVQIPINSRPIDLDGDGDADVVAGSRGEGRIFWFENTGVGSDGRAEFREHRIETEGFYAPPSVQAGRAILTGFNFAFADLSGDGRLDIVSREAVQYVSWLEQPASFEEPWRVHSLGDATPDFYMGYTLADINEDGQLDLMGGGYSRGERAADGDDQVTDSLGRLAWFENPGPERVREPWIRHDFSRRKRGMFDKFIARDLDNDGDVDFLSTRGNSVPYDGVFWLEQVRTDDPVPAFEPARDQDSQQMALPAAAD